MYSRRLTKTRDLEVSLLFFVDSTGANDHGFNRLRNGVGHYRVFCNTNFSCRTGLFVA